MSQKIKLREEVEKWKQIADESDAGRVTLSGMLLAVLYKFGGTLTFTREDLLAVTKDHAVQVFKNNDGTITLRAALNPERNQVLLPPIKSP